MCRQDFSLEKLGITYLAVDAEIKYDAIEYIK